MTITLLNLLVGGGLLAAAALVWRDGRRMQADARRERAEAGRLLVAASEQKRAADRGHELLAQGLEDARLLGEAERERRERPS